MFFAIVIIIGLATAFVVATLTGKALDLLPNNIIGEYAYAGFLLLCIYFVIKMSTSHIYKLLSGVSDDIREIKDKLGIQSIVCRTPEQMDNSTQNFITDVIERGDGIKEIKKILGIWKTFKYKWLIKYRIEEYAKKKICPQCETLYKSYKNKCTECDTVLIPAKERKGKNKK